MQENRQDAPRQLPSAGSSEWNDYRGPLRVARSGSGLKLAGLAVLGLSAMAWYYLGPDIKRYIRIRNM